MKSLKNRFMPAAKSAGVITLIILGVMLACAFAAAFFSLQKPVVVPLYQELAMGTEQKEIDGEDEGDSLYKLFQVPFMLQYITDSSDKRTIKYLSFKNIPELEFWNVQAYDVYEPDGFIYYEEDYEMDSLTQDPKDQLCVKGLYSLRCAELAFNEISEEMIEKLENPLVLTKATIHFSNGDEMNADIGQIVINPPDGTNTAFSSDNRNVEMKNMSFWELVSWLRDRRAE